jgi:hypothetical protein
MQLLLSNAVLLLLLFLLPLAIFGCSWCCCWFAFFDSALLHSNAVLLLLFLLLQL